MVVVPVPIDGCRCFDCAYDCEDSGGSGGGGTLLTLIIMHKY